MFYECKISATFCFPFSLKNLTFIFEVLDYALKAVDLI